MYPCGILGIHGSKVCGRQGRTGGTGSILVRKTYRFTAVGRCVGVLDAHVSQSTGVPAGLGPLQNRFRRVLRRCWGFYQAR